ncbi:MAG: hypothetical protein U5N27_17820 [Rhizobium sp.]|nr:hypothetical protein [Rhizobium sp.]
MDNGYEDNSILPEMPLGLGEPPEELKPVVQQPTAPAPVASTVVPAPAATCAGSSRSSACGCCNGSGDVRTGGYARGGKEDGSPQAGRQGASCCKSACQVDQDGARRCRSEPGRQNREAEAGDCWGCFCQD